MGRSCFPRLSGLLHPGSFLQSFLGSNGLERFQDGRPVTVSSAPQCGFIGYFLMTGPRLCVFGQHVTQAMLDSLHLTGSPRVGLSSGDGGDCHHLRESASFLSCTVAFSPP